MLTEAEAAAGLKEEDLVVCPHSPCGDCGIGMDLETCEEKYEEYLSQLAEV